MRIARVLHESSSTPIVALERDGAVYDVRALEESYDARTTRDALFAPTDFHARVIALGGAGLHALDDALRSGRRPSSARLLPDSFLWRAPCDTDRCARFRLELAG